MSSFFSAPASSSTLVAAFLSEPTPTLSLPVSSAGPSSAIVVHVEPLPHDYAQLRREHSLSLIKQRMHDSSPEDGYKTAMEKDIIELRKSCNALMDFSRKISKEQDIENRHSKAFKDRISKSMTDVVTDMARILAHMDSLRKVTQMAQSDVALSQLEVSSLIKSNSTALSSLDSKFNILDTKVDDLAANMSEIMEWIRSSDTKKGEEGEFSKNLSERAKQSKK